VANAAEALFIFRCTIPGTADDDAAKVGNSFLGDLKCADEIFMTLEAGGLAEETFWGVHVTDHADERNVWWQVEFATKRAGAVFVECGQVGAGIGEEDAIWLDAQRAIFSFGPAATGDPMILRASGGDIEFREETMFEMKRAGNLEDAWGGGELSKSGAEHQSGADVMSVNDVGLDLGD